MNEIERILRSMSRLTSVSERIANIFAIIVEKPGLRQLSAIKPNFNSTQKKHSKVTKSDQGNFSFSFLPAIHTASSVLLFHVGIFIKCIFENHHHQIQQQSNSIFASLLYYDTVEVERLFSLLNDNFLC